MTQETMKIIDPRQKMNPTDIIKTNTKIDHDQLFSFRDTSHEARIDSGTVHAIFLTTHANQVIFALEIGVHLGTMNIRVLTYPYATCHLLDVATHSIHL